jgi:hypothetical protein
MTNRDKLLATFIDAARALAGEGMGGLNPEKAIIVDAAMKNGADVILMYVTSTETVIGALNLPTSDSDPVTLFRIEMSEGATN